MVRVAVLRVAAVVRVAVTVGITINGFEFENKLLFTLYCLLFELFSIDFLFLIVSPLTFHTTAWQKSGKGCKSKLQGNKGPRFISPTMFRGTLMTDGMGVTVLKTNRGTRTGGPQCQKNCRTEREPNIRDFTVEELRPSTGYCVVIDPNCRDFLFCMHEISKPEKPFVMWYIKNNRAKERKEKKRNITR